MKKKQRKKENKIGKKMVFVIEAEPFRQECVVVCNGQFSDAIKLIRKHKTKSAQMIVDEYENNKDSFPDNYEIGNGSACLYTTLPKGYVMLLSHQGDWISTTRLVMHECLHLTHYVLKRAGITLTEESEESYTYLQEHLVEQVLRKIF